MKILLTGASGAIGPYIISELERSHQLVLFARRAIETQHKIIVGDLASTLDCLEAIEGVEAVVHMAAYSEPDPDAFRFNMMSTYALLEAARQAGVSRFIFASTNCVYGHCFPISQRKFQPETLPFKEEHPCLPEDNYGLSKRLGEQMLEVYSRVWGMKTAALRLCWVWRPTEIRWRTGLESLDVTKHAPYFWAYVDIRDAVQAVRLTLEDPALPNYGRYNISAGDHMAEEDSKELLARFYPEVPLHGALTGRQTFFDWSLAQRTFGYEPQYSWRAR